MKLFDFLVPRKDGKLSAPDLWSANAEKELGVANVYRCQLGGVVVAILDRIDAASGVRVEIHSLDSPWSTKRPEGWGVGWWVRVGGANGNIEGIVVRRFKGEPACIEILANGCVGLGVYSRPEYAITAYGPRVEVPRG